MEITNATIKSTNLTIDHGVLTFWLNLDYGGSGQGFGGIILYAPKSENNSDYCGKLITKILNTLELDSWEDLPGTSVRVKAEWNKVHEIGHLLNDEWVNPSQINNQN